MSEESPDYGPLGDYAAQIDAPEYFGGEELHPISSGRILAIKALGASMFDPTMDEVSAILSRNTYPKAAADAAVLIWALSQNPPVDESGRRQPSELTRAVRFPDQVFESVMEWAETVAQILPGQPHHDEAMKVFTRVFEDHWAPGYEDADKKDPLKSGGEDAEEPGKSPTHSGDSKSIAPASLGEPLITSAGLHRSNGESMTSGQPQSGTGQKLSEPVTNNGE